MSVKQLEKHLERLTALHEVNIHQWTELEGEVEKTLERLQNHSDQMEIFSRLQLSDRSLEMTREFPDIKDQLLQKLTYLSQQFESKIYEYHEMFSAQRSAVEELSEKCFEISAQLSVVQLVEERPGDFCLSTRMEQTNHLLNLYNSLELGLACWLEKRNQDNSVWRISSQLSLISLYKNP